MAITPSQPSAGKGRQIAKFVEGSTEKARQARNTGENKVKTQQQRVRSAKPSRREEIRNQRKVDDRRGKNVDVRA